MHRRRLQCCSILLLCWIQAAAAPDPAHHASNARIVDELRRVFVDRDPATAERKRAEALAEVARQASNDPEGTAYFNLLFNRSLTADDALPILDAFLFVNAIISKHHDRTSDQVITSGINDFEMYEGSTADRLAFLAERIRFQRRLIKSLALDDPAMGGSFDSMMAFEHAIYEIQGYARYAQLKDFLQRHGDVVLHVQEVHGRPPYARIQQLLEGSSRMPIPDSSQAPHTLHEPRHF